MRFLKRKHRSTALRLCVALTMILLALTGCYTATPSAGTATDAAENSHPRIALTAADMETACEMPSHIDLNQIDENVYLITQPGCYILSGELNGTLQIDVEDQLIHLVLDGVTIDSPYGPALEVLSAGKLFITLKEGTENYLSDAGAYSETPDADACIYSPCDMTLNGSGSLHVYGYYKDAVHSKDVLKVLGGNLFVQSKRDGLRGNDGIVINCGSVMVQSEGNGIYSTKTGKETKGNIEIYDTVCSVIGGNYAISCSSDLYIADSDIYAMGILSNIKVDGVSRIEEGNLQNE